MSANSPAPRALPSLAAACLLTIALPVAPGLAQEKTKTKPQPAAAAALEVDYSVSIPVLDAVGSTISDEALTEILRGAIADHAQDLAGWDAASVTVPEITLSVTSRREDGQSNTEITFTDLVLEDVADGVAATISLGGVTMETGKSSAAFGAMSAANFDIGQMLAVYGLVEGAGTAIETVYTDLSSAGGTLTADDVACTIGAVTGDEFRARPLRTSLVDMLALAQSLEDDPDDVDPALLGQMARFYADILTAFETSELRFDGISCEGEDGQGRAMAFGFAGMVMGGMSPGIYPSFSMDGLNIEVEGDGVMSLDNLTIKPTDFGAVIATLESMPDNVDAAWFDENARLLIPAMEGLSFAGFDMDIPDPDDEDARLKASIGAFDLTLRDYLNAIPTDIDISARNIRTVLPEDESDEALRQLHALGISEIDAGFRIAAAWNEDASSIDFEEISFNAADLGSVNVSGSLANVTAELFSLDLDTALAAAMGVAVKSVLASAEDRGLSDLILTIAAQEQGADAAILRAVYADLAKGTIIGMLAGLADAAKMGDAVGAFVRGEARTLEIGLTAKNDPGLAFDDFIEAEQNPASLLGKVDITVLSK